MVNSVVKARALSLVRVLKKMYPVVKTELTYATPFQFLSAVILSAQCTDKHINNVTPVLWKKYPTIEAVADASVLQFQKDLANVPFYRNKAKAIVHCARIILDKYAGTVPSTEEDL